MDKTILIDRLSGTFIQWISNFYIRLRDAFRPIARERKYLMDYKLGYFSADIICSEKRTFYQERT